MLDEIDGNVRLESFGDVLLAVKSVDELGEDGTLVELVGRFRRAVAERAVGPSSLEGQAGAVMGRKRVARERESEEEGCGGKYAKDGLEMHFQYERM